MTDAVLMLLGVAVGALLVLLVVGLRRRNETMVAQRLIDATQKEKAEELAAVIEQLKTTFAALSRDALSSNTDDFLKLAKTRLEDQATAADKSLESKKRLIDARLEEMGTKLTTLNTSVQRMGGSLESQIQVTNRLHKTTAQLREALANPQRRGQWGERMAEDVLRLVGLVKGVNYLKQEQLSEGTRPDFTFFLPDNRCVHMDVKFPLVNYLKMLDAADDSAREAAAGQFLKDVRSRIKEVTHRAYIDPAGGTVDYVLVFIPNEQVYGFIHEYDSSFLDDALRSKVVLCSPITLYAILAVIRQSVENFRFERSSRQVLDLLAAFKKQWEKYMEGMGKMGTRLEDAVKEYQHLVGVRRSKLDRQLDKIEDLRAARLETSDGALTPLAESPPA